MAQSPIKYLTVIQYFRDDRPWTSDTMENPSWKAVEDAVRKMDNYFFPIVRIGCGEPEDDDDSFNIIGGDGRIALFHFMGEWQFDDETGDENEVRLWDSDQGYYCNECNVINDIELVLRITKQYYDTGSYDHLDNIN